MATRKPRTKAAGTRKTKPKPKAAAQVVTPPAGVEAQPEVALEAKQISAMVRTMKVTHDRMGLIDNTVGARKVYKAGEAMTVAADLWPKLKALGYRRL
jgi:hypothetical protein